MKKLIAGFLIASSMIFAVSAKSNKFEDLMKNFDAEDTEIEEVEEVEVKPSTSTKGNTTKQNSKESKQQDAKTQAELKAALAEVEKLNAQKEELAKKIEAQKNDTSKAELKAALAELDELTAQRETLIKELEKYKNDTSKADLKAALAELEKLNAMNQDLIDKYNQEKLDMIAMKEVADHPFEHSELFEINVFNTSKGKVEVSDDTVKYKGTEYKGIKMSGNTGKPDGNWSSFYGLGLQLDKTNIAQAVRNSNCVSLKVLGDGNPYQIEYAIPLGPDQFKTLMYAFNTKKGEVTEIKVHVSEFSAWQNATRADIKDTAHIALVYAYGFNGVDRPANNTKFSATFFDVKFETDFELEKAATFKEENFLLYAENYRENINEADKGKVTISDTNVDYNGKSYKGIVIKGNTGIPVADESSWYDGRLKGYERNLEARFIKFLTKGKTMKMKVLGDGNKYKVCLGYWMNDEYSQWEYTFSTRKGKVMEVSIPFNKFQNWQHKKLDISKVKEFAISYEWGNPMAGIKRPGKNKDFEITVFDISVQ